MQRRFATAFFPGPGAASVFALVLCLGCQHGPMTPATGAVSAAMAPPVPALPTPVAEANLTQIEADSRSRLVRKVSYDLQINVLGSGEKSAERKKETAAKNVGATEFSGEQKVTFDLSAPTVFGLALDFKAGGTVTRLGVNGHNVSTDAYRDGRIALPPEALHAGLNTVEILFRQKYAPDGNGFYRFLDPEDRREYTWTNFEPYGANAMFPCFDQPDLKAKFKLHVVAPESWQVVSTQRESGVEKVLADPKKPERNGAVVWTFPETPPISTYLFSLHAGPYDVFRAQAGAIPLRLFVRHSLKPFVETELWFGVARAGLDFYGKYFAYPYPFAKYDQVIAPDFPDGAMENVAAVTFSEEFVPRGRSTRNERLRTAEVILHEMAHMWFGDLVTMQWWNGLWLNESFASYMAAVAFGGSDFLTREFGDGNVDFHSGMKRWAYWEDQLVTTHAIDGRVPDTKSAFTAFDGITYGKGASVLKQLDYFLGREKFRDGVRGYFKNHDYQNTRVEHFIGALSASSGRDLVPWSRAWLMSPGLDTVRADFSCAGGKMTGLDVKLVRPAASIGEGRPHRLEVGLFAKKAGRIELFGSLPIELLDEEPHIIVDSAALKGRACPLFVFPNAGDWDYVRVKLDEASLRQIELHLPEVADPLVRALLWTTLIEMQRDAEIAPQSYLRVAELALGRETDLKSAADLLRTVRSGADAFRFLPRAREMDLRNRSRITQRLENAVWKRVVAGQADSDEQKVFLDGYVELVESEAGASRIVALFEKTGAARRIPLDQDRRWRMIVRLMALGEPRARRLLEQERARDRSERGIQMSLAAEAAFPRADVKDIWLTRLLHPDAELTPARREVILRTFLPPSQDDLRAALAPKFFAGLLALAQAQDQDESERLARGMLPAVCSADSAAGLKAFLRERPTLPPAVLKVLRIGIQEDERCVLARERASAVTESAW